MRTESLKIHSWLLAIVSLLIVPSLLLAVFWVRDAYREVSGITRALDGLGAIEALHPILEARTLGHVAPEVVGWENLVSRLHPASDAASEFEMLYRKTIGQRDDAAAIADFRKLVRMIAGSTAVEPATPPEITGLALMVTRQILMLSERSIRLLKVARRMAGRPSLNDWDRMALPVQGGQYKAVSDTITLARRSDITGLPAWDAEMLERLSAEFGRANVRFQQAAAGMVMQLGNAERGADLDVSVIGSAYPRLAKATNNLWLASSKTLRQVLTDRREEVVTNLSLTGAVGAFSILFALVAAIFLGRALASRTHREFENVGFYDPLTGLPNRRALIQTLEAGLHRGTGQRLKRMGVLHLDLVRFKAVNDTFGEKVGDALLRDTATLLGRLCPKDIVMRIGGNEFAIVTERFSRTREIGMLALRLVREIAKERTIEGCVCETGVYIGIAAVNGSSSGAEQMLKDAELALMMAKKAGSAGFEIFEPQMRAEFQQRNALAEELRVAIGRGHIRPFFQPQIDLVSGKVVGVETLIRWIDPEKGVTSPGVFLPVAAEFGLMATLDEIVRERAIDAMKAWRKAGIAIDHIGLNMTASSLADPDVVDHLVQAVEDNDLWPSAVSIEVLESVMVDTETAGPIKQNVAKLADLGFLIDLDDFGTGHAGIASLRDLRVNRIKIDRSFVDGVDQDPELAKLTNAMIQLAHSLNIRVLAEGVETRSEQAWLKEHGCHEIQGYLLCKPMSFEAISQWLAEDRADKEFEAAADAEPAEAAIAAA